LRRLSDRVTVGDVIRFGVLGALEAREGRRALELGSARQRALLAFLLMHANEVVSSDRLIDALWGENRPASAAKVVQGYVSRLRRGLSAETILTRGSGYVLRTEAIDALEFEHLVARAREADPRRASAMLGEALDLWRGRAFADVEYEPWAVAEIARLEECRIVAVEERVDVDLELGEASRLVPELDALVADHPLRERLRAQLMLALYRSGRQADALQVFAEGRKQLVEELGIQPGTELRQLQRRILAHDPELAPAPCARPRTVPTRGLFVGRDHELGALGAGLEAARAGSGRLFLLVGEPGIGKTRLAEEFGADARARGCRVLAGRCWEAGGAPAYWPWLQAIRARLRESDTERRRSQLGSSASELAQILPELRELYPDLPEPPSLDPESARFRLFEAVSSFLVSAAEESPLLLVLDDLHAADEPSLLLLRFLARNLGESRIVVVGAYRDADPTVGGELAVTLVELAREPVTRTLALRGLAETEVGRFIELTASQTPSAGVIETVHTRELRGIRCSSPRSCAFWPRKGAWTRRALSWQSRRVCVT
jgi:DNA-binding SARP family transcriptional activator